MRFGLSFNYKLHFAYWNVLFVFSFCLKFRYVRRTSCATQRTINTPRDPRVQRRTELEPLSSIFRRRQHPGRHPGATSAVRHIPRATSCRRRKSWTHRKRSVAVAAYRRHQLPVLSEYNDGTMVDGLSDADYGCATWICTTSDRYLQRWRIDSVSRSTAAAAAAADPATGGCESLYATIPAENSAAVSGVWKSGESQCAVDIAVAAAAAAAAAATSPPVWRSTRSRLVSSVDTGRRRSRPTPPPRRAVVFCIQQGRSPRRYGHYVAASRLSRAPCTVTTLSKLGLLWRSVYGLAWLRTKLVPQALLFYLLGLPCTTLAVGSMLTNRVDNC